jgi:hypothetical protein
MEGEESPMKIRIFDDESKQREEFSRMVSQLDFPDGKFDIGVFDEEQFTAILDNMRTRQGTFREQGSWTQDGDNLLDDVDILIVDFDLFEAKGVMDADQIAYLSRCFTTCGVIVIMNRVSHSPFDLTLKGHPRSFADVEIGQDQLKSPVLWGIGQDSFSPWYWPVLPKLAMTFQQRIEDVENALDKNLSIREMLGGFSEETWQWLPKNVLQFLGENDSLENMLRTSPFALNPKDRVGLKEKDNYKNSVSRLLAARISKWLEAIVLPELDILVDAPHLALRFPSLILGNKEENSTWNSVAVRHENKVPGFNMDVIKKSILEKSHWLSRPVWFWRDLMTCTDISEVKEPWNTEHVMWVFCEDTSSFWAEDECTPFKANTVSPFASRYVKKLDGIDYLPVQRFAL